MTHRDGDPQRKSRTNLTQNNNLTKPRGQEEQDENFSKTLQQA